MSVIRRIGSSHDKIPHFLSIISKMTEQKCVCHFLFDRNDMCFFFACAFTFHYYVRAQYTGRHLFTWWFSDGVITLLSSIIFFLCICVSVMRCIDHHSDFWCATSMFGLRTSVRPHFIATHAGNTHSDENEPTNKKLLLSSRLHPAILFENKTLWIHWHRYHINNLFFEKKKTMIKSIVGRCAQQQQNSKAIAYAGMDHHQHHSYIIFI